METTVHRAYPATRLACIVNLLHRMALGMPQETFPAGMTISQLSTVSFLYFSYPKDVYQRDIESFFKLRRSTVSSQLDTLERKGLLARVPVPHDARLKKLILTPAGQQVSAQVLKAMDQMNQRLLQGLTEDEVSQLTQLLEKIEANLSKEAP